MNKRHSVQRKEQGYCDSQAPGTNQFHCPGLVMVFQVTHAYRLYRKGEFILLNQMADCPGRESPEKDFLQYPRKILFISQIKCHGIVRWFVGFSKQDRVRFNPL